MTIFYGKVRPVGGQKTPKEGAKKITTIPIEHTFVILQAIELLLAATFNVKQDGVRQSFLFGRPGSSLGTGAELFYTKVGLLKAALHVRDHGHSFLRNLSIRELEAKLTHFLKENYWLMAEETWGRWFQDSFAANVSTETKAKLSNLLATSEIFAPSSAPTLFPLVPVRVANDFDSEPFFLIQPLALNEDRLCQTPQPCDLLPEQFPPFRNWQGIRKTPGAWLGVRSPTLSTSRKMRSAILGAVALLPHSRQRYMFSGREMFGGQATMHKGWSLSFGEPHTPPLYQDLVINADDHKWLSVLAVKLMDKQKDTRKHVKALEYYYRAWLLEEMERFPVLFMVLDAIFGDSSQATQAVG